MRLRKYIEIEGLGFTSKHLMSANTRRALREGFLATTGREVMLDTDFAVQGTFDEWDREAGVRIANRLGLNHPVQVVRM